ncbi:RND transporter [Opitutaceae bacterium EW11]|nr:RND transporter [Opitutaceae bacterium EW11]
MNAPFSMARPNLRLVPAALGLSTALVFSSCALGPDYRRPEVAQPAAFKGIRSPESAVPQVGRTWWTLFNDSELTALMEKTVAANLDIQAAMARVEQAHALVTVSGGALFPSVDAGATARRARSSSSSGSLSTIDGGTGTTHVTPAGRITNVFSLPLSLSYEIDLWGRLRRQLEASQNSAWASEDDLEFVRQTALASVAQGVFNIRYYDTQQDVLERTIELYRKQIELTQSKVRAGLALQTDLLQARTQLDAATAQMIDVRRAREKQEHAIAVLLGQAPEAFSMPRRPLTLSVPALPVGAPATLLRQRPDVARAERNLAAANAQIGVAEAAFLPTFSLTGSAGYQSTQLDGLTSWSNRVWSIGPSVSLPLFRGGELRGTLQQRRAAYQELVATYRSAVLGAYRDVEDQLTDLHLLADKADVLNATLVSARENARLTEIQYRQGIVPYLQVITANQTLLNDELASAQALNQRLTASVLLIKAIGGGWTDPRG